MEGTLRRGSIVGAALLLSLSALPADAQTADQYQAYVAMVGTPIGALPPIMTSTIAGEFQRGMQFALRYGYMSDLSVPVGGGRYARAHIGANNFAGSVIFGSGLGSTLTLTAGAFNPSCSGCSTKAMVSAGGDMRLGSSALGPTPASPLFTVNLNGELGLAGAEHGHYTTGMLGLPLALILRTPGLSVAPFVTPEFGFGNATYDATFNDAHYSGSRVGVGGGVGVYNPASTVALNFGFQWINVPRTTAVYGVSLRLGR